jgi:hypothetical protein
MCVAGSRSCGRGAWARSRGRARRNGHGDELCVLQYNPLYDANLRNFFSGNSVRSTLFRLGMVSVGAAGFCASAATCNARGTQIDREGRVIDADKHKGKLHIIEQEFANVEKEEEERLKEEEEIRRRVRIKRHEAIARAQQLERLAKIREDRRIRSEIVRIARGEVVRSTLSGSLPHGASASTASLRASEKAYGSARPGRKHPKRSSSRSLAAAGQASLTPPDATAMEHLLGAADYEAGMMIHGLKGRAPAPPARRPAPVSPSREVEAVSTGQLHVHVSECLGMDQFLPDDATHSYKAYVRLRLDGPGVAGEERAGGGAVPHSTSAIPIARDLPTVWRETVNIEVESSEEDGNEPSMLRVELVVPEHFTGDDVVASTTLPVDIAGALRGEAPATVGGFDVVLAPSDPGVMGRVVLHLGWTVRHSE